MDWHRSEETFAAKAPAIRSERLVLEPLSLEHAEEMAPVLDDPRLHTYIGGEPLSLSQLRVRYAMLAAGPSIGVRERWLNWILRRLSDDVAVGYVQATLTPAPQGVHARVAWMVGASYQGSGYATEAARAMLDFLAERGISQVGATIHPENRDSIAVAIRLGMVASSDFVDGEVVWRLTSPFASGR